MSSSNDLDIEDDEEENELDIVDQFVDLNDIQTIEKFKDLVSFI